MLCAGCTSARPAQTPVIVHNACPKVSLCPMPGSDPQTNGDLSADKRHALPLPWSRKRTHPRGRREKTGSIYHGTAPAGARHPFICHLCRFACGRRAACRTGCTTGRHCAQQYAGVFLYRIPRRDRRLG
ncbi:Rz1-like lysis system protein LysC [Escherichia coli]|uniref:Rz1-like lysis system protein LysC n=1 Tax=Escherichia coli TaxID=562 RepID=UPI0020770246|nr:Rz1-like lysis system protein LysC [Escherichia coli]